MVFIAFELKETGPKITSESARGNPNVCSYVIN